MIYILMWVYESVVCLFDSVGLSGLAAHSGVAVSESICWVEWPVHVILYENDGVTYACTGCATQQYGLNWRVGGTP